MPVYHVVLFKLKPDVTEDQKNALGQALHNMVGKIPGLTKMSVGPTLPVSVPRSQGFNMGLVAILDHPDDVPKYGAHPAHQIVHKMREEMCSDTIAYDLEF